MTTLTFSIFFWVRLAIDRLNRRRIRAGRVLRYTFNKQSTLMSLLGVKLMGEKFLQVEMKMEGVKVRQKLIQSLVRYLAVVLSRVMPCYFSRQVFFS